MADDVENKAKRFFADATPGQCLRAAREEKKLTTKAIAKQLCVDSWILDAIERDEYSALGAPVFAKGHLRKYANTLGVDPNELMVAYYQIEGTRDTPPLIAESILRVEAAHAPRFAWFLPTAIVMAAVASVAAAALWYLRSDAPRPPAAARERPAATTQPNGERSGQLTLPVANAATATEPPLTAFEEAPVDEPATANGQQQAEPVATPRDPQPEPANVEAAGRTRPAPAPQNSLTLTLRFRTESWVEVYDANRRKMLYGLGEAETVQYLSGPPPIQVFLGRQSGVDVEVNGQPFTVPAQSRRGNTARFRIAGPRAE